jgi:hypothetical protein
MYDSTTRHVLVKLNVDPLIVILVGSAGGRSWSGGKMALYRRLRAEVIAKALATIRSIFTLRCKLKQH